MDIIEKTLDGCVLDLDKLIVLEWVKCCSQGIIENPLIFIGEEGCGKSTVTYNICKVLSNFSLSYLTPKSISDELNEKCKLYVLHDAGIPFEKLCNPSYHRFVEISIDPNTNQKK